MSLLIVLAWIVVAPLVLATLLRAVFALAYLLIPAKPVPSDPSDKINRFLVVIPAHDEELLIDHVLESIRANDYPREAVSVCVIADNCTDGTADRVRMLGEEVRERFAPDNRGKGQALDWLFEQVELTDWDAIALVDADNLVTDGFFQAMNAHLNQGWNVIQAYDDMTNPDESIMTRLLKVTYVMKNELFCAGKQRLGRSMLLMGTGMVFRAETLDRFGWAAMSTVEDYEQALNFAEAGEPVQFAEDACVQTQESASLGQGYSQRQRWMSGRFGLTQRALGALGQGIRERNGGLIDLSIELLMPTYATHLNLSIIASGIAALALPWSHPLFLTLFAVLVYQVFEVMTALVLMRASWRFIRSLVFAPVFLVWRAGIDVLAAFGPKEEAWVRTERITHVTAEESIDTPGPSA